MQWLRSERRRRHTRRSSPTPRSRAVSATRTLDHVAFAADDPGRGRSPRSPSKPHVVQRRPGAFQLRPARVVEIVRDTDRPDAWWCPMHPDVRVAGGGQVSAVRDGAGADPAAADRRVQARRRRSCRQAGGGASGLTLAVRDPETGEPVTSVRRRPRTAAPPVRHQPRPARSSRMCTRSPGRTDASSCGIDLAAGEYMLIADFLPAGGDVADRPARRRDAGLPRSAVRAAAAELALSPIGTGRRRPADQDRCADAGADGARPLCASTSPMRRPARRSPICSRISARRVIC